MKSRIPNMSIGYYVNMRTVEAVYRALDIPMGDMNRGKMNGVMDEEDGEIVEEEVDNIYGHDEVWSPVQMLPARFSFQPFSVILEHVVTQLWLIQYSYWGHTPDSQLYKH